MDVEIREEPMSHLAEHARVSIAFEVDRVLDLTDQDAGLGGLVLLERPLPRPYLKDYDAITGNHPTEWERRFDLSNWSMVLVAGRRGTRKSSAALERLCQSYWLPLPSHPSTKEGDIYKHRASFLRYALSTNDFSDEPPANDRIKQIALGRGSAPSRRSTP